MLGAMGPRGKRRRGEPPAPAATKAPAGAAAASIDNFLDGGFEAAAAAAVEPASGRRGGRRAAPPAPAAASDGSGSDGDEAVAAVAPRRRSSRAASHRADLDALAAKDPEFYEYLQSADAGLLDFEGGEESEGSEGGSEDDAGASDSDGDDALTPAPALGPSSDESGSESDGSDSDRGAAPAAAAAAPATPPSSSRPAPPAAQILAWCAAATADPSLRSVRALLQAYRAAAHTGDAAATDDDPAAATALARAPAASVNALILFVLKEGDGLLTKLLGSPPTGTDVRTLPRWKKVDPLARSFLGNTLHLLTSMADPSMTAFILRRLRPSARLLVCSERLARKTLQAALVAFGGDDPGAAVAAALFVRAYADVLPGDGPADAALKGAYRSFVGSAKFASAPAAAPRLALQAAALVDLYAAAPPGAAYQHAFAYVRQLAGLVRGAGAGRVGADAHRSVYCWQTVTCLELWARLVGELAPSRVPDLAPLAFPVQTLLAAATALVPAARYHPLHLRLLRSAAALAAATGTYVPLSAPLIDMLSWKGLSTPARGGGARRGGGVPRGLDPSLLRASKAALASPSFQHDLVDGVMELLAAHLAPWAASPALPELARAPLARLRAFSKGSSVDRFRAAARGLISAIEASAATVAAARADGTLAPRDGPGVAAFTAARGGARDTPLGRHADALAAAARERRELAAAAAVKYGEDGRSRRDRRGKDGSDDESASDGEPPARAPPAKKARAAAAAADAAPAPRKPSRAPVSAAAGWAEDEGADDVLAPYVESDSD
jgi:nucleolar complex protein 2